MSVTEYSGLPMELLKKSDSISGNIVSIFAYLFLFIPNLIGCWMALILIQPKIGNWLHSYSYGKWAMLHLNLQLYGWSSIPLLGAFSLYFMNKNKQSSPHDILIICLLWTIALIGGSWHWLSGGSSGKIFLDWSGHSLHLFCGSILLIWAVLVWNFLSAFKSDKVKYSAKNIIEGLGLLTLLAVPISLFLTSHDNVYPPINPNSGGATGHSLLASTSGLIFIILLLFSYILPNNSQKNLPLKICWGYLLFCLISYLGIRHGNASNDETNQILGLAVLLGWIPLLSIYFRTLSLNVFGKKWSMALIFWWALLTLNGFTFFIPDWLIQTKFTNGFVAHSHLAMAGFVTALNQVILSQIQNPVAESESKTTTFYLWNVSLGLYLISMFSSGIYENNNFTGFMNHSAYVQFLYSLRLIAGLGMTLASAIWFVRAYRPLLQNFKTRSTLSNTQSTVVYPS